MKTSNRTDDPIRTRRGYKKWKSEIYYGNFRHGANVGLRPPAPGEDPRARARATSAGFRRDASASTSSYHVFCTTRLVRFVEMEYAIPRADDGRRPARRSATLIEREGLLVDFPVEIRGIGADDIPLSMGAGRETCYLAVHMSTGTPFERYFRGVEAIMDGLGGRPHWGKMHFQTARDARAALPGVGAVPGGAPAASIRTARFRSEFADRVLGTP